MAQVQPSLNVGDRTKMTLETLLILLEKAYKDLAEAVNSKPDIYERTTDGQTSDVFLSQGTLNINSTTNKVEMLTAHTSANTVTWKQLS